MMMCKRILGAATLAAAIAIVLAGPAGAASTTYVVKAKLDTKALASVKDASGASGTLTGKLTIAGKKSSFTWTLTFRHLSGTALRADIYFGNGKTGLLALPLCRKCQAPSAHGAYVGPYVANASFVRKILHGGAYAVVGTKTNPRGEIRGQIKTTA
jgi:hypothetical protein